MADEPLVAGAALRAFLLLRPGAPVARRATQLRNLLLQGLVSPPLTLLAAVALALPRRPSAAEDTGAAALDRDGETGVLAGGFLGRLRSSYPSSAILLERAGRGRPLRQKALDNLVGKKNDMPVQRHF